MTGTNEYEADGWRYYRSDMNGALYRQRIETGICDRWTGSEWIEASRQVALDINATFLLGGELYGRVPAAEALSLVAGEQPE